MTAGPPSDDQPTPPPAPPGAPLAPTAEEDAGAEALFNEYNGTPPNPWKTHDGRDVPHWPAISDQVKEKWRAVYRAKIRGEGVSYPLINPQYPLLPPKLTEVEVAQVAGLLTVARMRVGEIKVLEKGILSLFGGNPAEAETVRDAVSDFAWGLAPDDPVEGARWLADAIAKERAGKDARATFERVGTYDTAGDLKGGV